MHAPALLLDPSSNPIAAAKWTVTYITEVENLLAEAKELFTDAEINLTTKSTSEDDPVAELVSRWIKYAPMNAATLQTLHAQLPQMGFTFKLSDPRGEGGPRTYVRVLRADGKSAGYLHSTSFTFVGARHDAAIKDDDRVYGGGRYPHLALSKAGALDLILDIAGRFAKG